jgi:hypothetical protein
MYRTIKLILNNHIRNGVKSLWTWKDNNFTCIYKNYASTDKIFTPKNLLKKIKEKEEAV